MKEMNPTQFLIEFGEFIGIVGARGGRRRRNGMMSKDEAVRILQSARENEFCMPSFQFSLVFWIGSIENDDDTITTLRNGGPSSFILSVS
jgi:hypothetical protein